MPARLADDRWVVLYDAECGLCTWLLVLLLSGDRSSRLQPVALQHAAVGELLADLAPEARMSSWHLISPAGERFSGGAAISPLLGLLPHGQLPAVAFARCPRVTERGYRWVAEHRSLLSRLLPERAKRRASERLAGGGIR